MNCLVACVWLGVLHNISMPLCWELLQLRKVPCWRFEVAVHNLVEVRHWDLARVANAPWKIDLGKFHFWRLYSSWSRIHKLKLALESLDFAIYFIVVPKHEVLLRLLLKDGLGSFLRLGKGLLLIWKMLLHLLPTGVKRCSVVYRLVNVLSANLWSRASAVSHIFVLECRVSWWRWKHEIWLIVSRSCDAVHIHRHLL